MSRRPETTVVEEILEEGSAGAENDGVRRELDGREEVEGGMDMIHWNSALLFWKQFFGKFFSFFYVCGTRRSI